MSNEYDYSGLYNNTSGGQAAQNNAQPAQPEQTAPQQPAQDSAYPNVGSSGANTANTARTDYSGCGASPQFQQDNSGYTSSFSGGNGGSGGYNGYSYASAPQQPPMPEKKKGGHKVLLRVLAGVGVVALGFGGGFGGQPQPRRGQDMNVTLNVTFDEAFNGTEKRITVRIPGKSESDTHTVKVPAGAVDGGRVRLKGQGAPGENGGAAGDLLITTKIDAHPYFGRDKADVTVDLPINVAEAALGASIVVPTPDGKKIKVKVPAGTQDGKVLTIKGKGAPDLKNKGQFGNLKIQIHVEVPTDMNDEQKKAMEDFLAATGEEKRPWA